MSGGNRPRATLRPGPVKSGRPRRFAFQRMEIAVMSEARKASVSQIFSHPEEFDCCAARQAAASAVRPRMTCPQPGTAVKEAERSMVSRMKRRSAAGSGGESGTGVVGIGRSDRWGWRRRRWREPGIQERIDRNGGDVEYFVVQSRGVKPLVYLIFGGGSAEAARLQSFLAS